MPNLSDIKYFYTISNTLNMSRAAEMSGVSQPALSHSLKRLEVEIGVQLLYRDKKGVRLTAAGRQFATKCKDLIHQWTHLSESIQQFSQAVSGRYKIGAHASVASYAFPKFITKLLIDYPGIEIELIHASSNEITRQVIEWQIDFGIVVNPTPHPDLVIRPIGKDVVTFWKLDSLKGDQETLFYNPNPQSLELVRLLNKKNIHFKRKIETTSFDLILSLVSEGCGVGILPARIAQPSSQNLVQCFRNIEPLKDKICLINRHETQGTVSSKAIIKSIMEAKI